MAADKKPQNPSEDLVRTIGVIDASYEAVTQSARARSLSTSIRSRGQESAFDAQSAINIARGLRQSLTFHILTRNPSEWKYSISDSREGNFVADALLQGQAIQQTGDGINLQLVYVTTLPEVLLVRNPNATEGKNILVRQTPQ